jgi:membrane-bound metal-dependent hydrolase YbcI (DUF457 family)
MAAFREHVTFSTVLGFGYAVGLKSLGAEPSHAVLAGGLCGLAGMLPDLDSDSGKPVRELFGLLAAVAALVCFHRLGDGDRELRMLLAAGVYLMVRFGLAFLVKRLTEHRGMFHSLPAAVIAGLATFLVFDDGDLMHSLGLAGGVFLGFLSHLVLDELYAVDFRGMKVKVNQFGGTAIKLFSKSVPATVTCWALLLALSYRVAVSEGFLPEKLPTVTDLRAARNQVYNYLGVSKSRPRPEGTTR